MLLRIQRLFRKQILAAVVMVALLALATIGMYSMTGSDGMMVACPLMSETATLCPMTLMEHLSQWQAMTRAVVPQGLLLLAALLFLVFWIVQPIHRLRLLNPPNSISIFFYRRYQSQIRSLNRMLLAFSDGILNPKLFA